MPSSSPPKKHILMKVVLVGLTKAGKTALFKQFTKKEFLDQHQVTKGADFHVKEFDVKENIVRLQIWDTAGGEPFLSLGTAYYRGAEALVVCVSPDDTIENISEFLEENVFTNIINKETMMVVIATKSDLTENQSTAIQTKLDSLKKFIRENGYTNVPSITMATSAKTGENVAALFQSIVEEWVKQQPNQEKQAPKALPFNKSASANSLKKSKLIKPMLRAWKHLKHHYGRYALGLVLALSFAALLTIPGIGQALGLAGAIGYLVASTALQLGLLAAGIGLCIFLAAVLGGYAMDKIKQRRASKTEKSLTHSANGAIATDREVDAATTSILQQPNTANPVGAFGKDVATTSATQTTTSSNSSSKNNQWTSSITK